MVSYRWLGIRNILAVLVKARSFIEGEFIFIYKSFNDRRKKHYWNMCPSCHLSYSLQNTWLDIMASSDVSFTYDSLEGVPSRFNG